MNKQQNILYFEGAGMNFYDKEQTDFSDVGNFRIRTSFKNLDGIQFYIELGNCPRYNDKHKKISDWGLRIDHLFKVEEKNIYEEIKKTTLAMFHNDYEYEMPRDNLEIRKLDYTKSSITKWINENLNCDFDSIQVLSEFYGYRVHAGNGVFNLMEEINVNHERANARKKCYEKIDNEYKEKLNEKYSKINLLSMKEKSIVIRSYASAESLSNANLEREREIVVDY